MGPTATLPEAPAYPRQKTGDAVPPSNRKKRIKPPPLYAGSPCLNRERPFRKCPGTSFGLLLEPKYSRTPLPSTDCKRRRRAEREACQRQKLAGKKKLAVGMSRGCLLSVIAFMTAFLTGLESPDARLSPICP